jgi:uncharacterized protein (TIGR03792 family)
MVIEQLSFQVPLALQGDFLRHDAAIWTPVLAAHPGFLGKEVWRETDSPDALHLIIRWASRAEWKAVPHDLLAATDQRFIAAMGQVFAVLRCNDQDVVA